jgi:hypothetical protein
MIKQEAHMRAFIETVGNITLFKYQVKFLNDCLKKKRVIGVFSRQTGKTTTIALFSIYFALNNDKTTTLIIAPTQRQSSELFDRMRNFAEYSGLTSGLIKSSTRTEIRWNNGSIIRCLPTGDFGYTIKGQTAHLLILEESPFIKDSVVNEVIMPMIAATDGSVIQIGTPFSKNHFFEASMSDKYAVHKYNYKHCPLIKEDFIEEQKNNLTSLEFSTEYLAEFIEDSDCYFPRELLNSCIFDLPKLESAMKNSLYYLGVDFARMGQDSSVFCIIRKDLSNGEFSICYLEETKHKLLTDAIGRVRILNERFDFQRIVLDETGLGAGPTDVLREQIGYKIEPLTFTVKSKQDIYSNLKLWMEKGRLKIPSHKKLIYQLSDLRYEIMSSGQFKIHHSERGHDDYSDALALAMWPSKCGDYVYKPTIC